MSFFLQSGGAELIGFCQVNQDLFSTFDLCMERNVCVCFDQMSVNYTQHSSVFSLRTTVYVEACVLRISPCHFSLVSPKWCTSPAHWRRSYDIISQQPMRDMEVHILWKCQGDIEQGSNTYMFGCILLTNMLPGSLQFLVWYRHCVSGCRTLLLTISSRSEQNLRNDNTGK